MVEKHRMSDQSRMNISIHDKNIQNERWIEGIPGNRPGLDCRMISILRHTFIIYTLLLPLGLAVAQEKPENPPFMEEKSSAEDNSIVENSIVIVEGQILDHMGGGQRGVTVTVRHKGEKDQSGETVEGEVVATATTDQYGDFSVSVTKELHGDFVVIFSKPMFTDLVMEVHIGHDDEPAFISEILEGALSLRGLVIDEKTKKPIENASVKFETYGRDISEKTNAQGQFIIKELTPGSANLIVEVEGYGREQQSIHNIQKNNDLTISVKPERIVHVYTLDESEKPLQGVTVECYDRPRDDFRTLITDEKGTVTFTGLHFDVEFLSLRISHDDFVSTNQFDQHIDLPSEKIETTHRIVLIRAGQIAGQLLELDSGKPIYGARVMTGDEYTDDSPRDWSNDEGRFMITGVSPGRVAVTVHISGFAPDLQVVEVKSGETAKLNLKLRNALVLSGVVEDTKGKPVRGAFIETVKWRGRTTLNLRSMSTHEGNFVMENAPTDEFEISVRAAGHRRMQKMVKAGGDAPVKFILTNNARPGGTTGSEIANVGDTAPAFNFKSIAGKTFKLSELKGKYVLLDFWATWCAPCIEEMPELIEVHEKFGSRDDFVMIGISRDLDKSSLKGFLKRNDKVVWPQVYGEEGGVPEALKNYGITWIPQIFIIDKEGKVVARDLRGEMIMTTVKEIFSK